jgi:hypothetical protein
MSAKGWRFASLQDLMYLILMQISKMPDAEFRFVASRRVKFLLEPQLDLKRWGLGYFCYKLFLPFP